MNIKPISPKIHGIADYILVGSLFVLPKMLGMSKPVQAIYAAQAAGLLAYVGLTEQPAAIKPMIPFRIHGKIDPFNVLSFAAQTFCRPFRRDRAATKFNVAFTLLTGALVLLTDWSGRTQPRLS